MPAVAPGAHVTPAMAAEPGRQLALFDFDGTITIRETMPDFMRASVGRGRRWLGTVALAPLVLGYRLDLVSGTTIRRVVVRFGYRGRSVTALRAAGRAFAMHVLPQLLREETMRRIAWHRDQGHTVAVVSGGLDAYLSPWCAAHGLDLLCSSLEQRDGVLTGRYLGRQCVLAEKVRRVRERYDLGAYSVIHAYGDTHEDHALLAMAHRRHYRGRELTGPAPG